MDWIELTVLTTTAGSELVSQQLIEAGSAGTMIQDRQDVMDYQNSRPEGRWDILDEKLLENMPTQVQVTGYYPKDFQAADLVEQVRRRMEDLRARTPGMDLGTLEIRTGSLDDEDWAQSWKKDFTPFRLGEHLLVKPTWCQVQVEPEDRVIEIDPGMAFGTGTHETTALCAALMEQSVRPGDRVTDLGTGTGILAMAAALCGAGSVLATDIDPVAVKVAAENIARNHLDGVIRTRQGDLLQAVDQVADVVVANIIADVVCQLAAPVRDYIKPGGYFICSGIARERQEQVRQALEAAGYASIEVREKGEWAAMRAKRSL